MEEIKIEYVVYELNNVMGSERHKALEKVNFSGYVSNSFDTENEAILAIKKEDRTYEPFVILKEVTLR